MRLALIFSILFYLGVSLISCAQTKSNKTFPPNNKASKIDTSNIAIIKLSQKAKWPFDKNYKPTNLTEREIIEIDSLLKTSIIDYNKSLLQDLKDNYSDDYSINFKKFKYKLQYVAVINKKGEKEVWVNGFCNTHGDNWKKEIILVFDGGNCYFNLKINLTKKKYFDVNVNGYA